MGGNYSGWDKPKTETECFINHTHIMDEFLNEATFRHREEISDELDEVEEIDDESHRDFIMACDRKNNSPDVGDKTERRFPK